MQLGIYYGLAYRFLFPENKPVINTDHYLDVFCQAQARGIATLWLAAGSQPLLSGISYRQVSF